jgi:undecaprenyl-diphosphatase
VQAVAIVLCLALAGFAVLGAGMRHGYSWDRWLLGFTHVRLQGRFDELVNGVAYGTMIVGGVLAAAVLLVLLRHRQRRELLFWVLGLAGIMVLDLTLKPLFHRAPIGHGGGYSFPSGNAMATMGGAVCLVFVLSGTELWKRLLLFIAFIAVALNGAAVVYLRWHYASDVLAGWCVAAAWIYLLWLALAARGGAALRSPLS